MVVGTPVVVRVVSFRIREVPRYEGRFRARATVYDADGNWLHTQPFRTLREALDHARSLRLGAQLMGVRSLRIAYPTPELAERCWASRSILLSRLSASGMVRGRFSPRSHPCWPGGAAEWRLENRLIRAIRRVERILADCHSL